MRKKCCYGAKCKEDSLNHEIIWGIVMRHIPILKQEVIALLTSNESMG